MNSKLKWGLIIAIAAMLISGIIYFLAKLGIIKKITDNLEPTTIKIFIFIFAGIIGIVGIVWLTIVMFKKVTNRKDSDNDSQIEAPKQRVDPMPAVDIFIEQAIIHNNIEYRIDYNKKNTDGKDGKIIPIHEKAIIIRNETTYFDETGQTSDKFVSFEAIFTRGNRPGMKTVKIPLDHGEEHIRKNWRQWIRDHKSMNMLPSLNFDMFPQSSAQELSERYSMMALRYVREEGYSESEVKQYFEPFMPKNNVKPKPVTPLEQPTITGQAPMMMPDDDDSSDTNDSIEKDKELYRKRNS